MTPTLPTHGPTGSKVIKCELRADSNDQIVHYGEHGSSGGIHFVAGQPTFFADVECEDGTTACAVGDGERWKWTERRTR